MMVNEGKCERRVREVRRPKMVVYESRGNVGLKTERERQDERGHRSFLGLLVVLLGRAAFPSSTTRTREGDIYMIESRSQMTMGSIPLERECDLDRSFSVKQQKSSEGGTDGCGGGRSERERREGRTTKCLLVEETESVYLE